MRRMPATIDRALAIARHRASLLGKKGSASWADRARARVAHRQYEAFKFAEGVEGDELLNSAAAFELRALVRKDPQVASTLCLWWRVALASSRRRRADAESLMFEDYRLIYIALFRQIVGEADYEEADAEESAFEEFASDTGSAEVMDEGQFSAAMFELADLHVPSLCAADYAAFLSHLLDEIIAAGALTDGDLRLAESAMASKRTLEASATLGRACTFGGRCASPDDYDDGGSMEGHRRPAGSSSLAATPHAGLSCHNEHAVSFLAMDAAATLTRGAITDGVSTLLPPLSAADGGEGGGGSDADSDRLGDDDGENRGRRRQVRRDGVDTDAAALAESSSGTSMLLATHSGARTQFRGLAAALSSARVRPDCVGCMGLGARCHECWHEERSEKIARFASARADFRESLHVYESATPQLWARRHAAGLPRALPPLPPPGPPSLYLPSPPTRHVPVGGLNPWLTSDEHLQGEVDGTWSRRTSDADRDWDRDREAWLMLPIEPPLPEPTPVAAPPPLVLLVPPPSPPRTPPSKALFPLPNTLNGSLMPPSSALAPQALPPPAVRCSKSLPSLPHTATAAAARLRQIPVGNLPCANRSLWLGATSSTFISPSALAESILRPSRSLPPIGLTCGYGGLGSSTGLQRLDPYRRALSSAHSLPAYVQGLERHHRCDGVLGRAYQLQFQSGLLGISRGGLASLRQRVGSSDEGTRSCSPSAQN